MDGWMGGKRQTDRSIDRLYSVCLITVCLQVRDRMERQAGQVKKLEANHSHLLKRDNFKVLIFQVTCVCV